MSYFKQLFVDFELNLSSNSMESLQEANLVDSAADHKKEVYDDGTRDRSGKKLKSYKKPRCPRKNQTRQNKLRVIRIKVKLLLCVAYCLIRKANAM